jgi:hypothetical protein
VLRAALGDGEEAKLYQDPVHEQENEVLPMRGEQTLERHEDETGETIDFKVSESITSTPKEQT